jgi:hypothetical protein
MVFFSMITLELFEYQTDFDTYHHDHRTMFHMDYPVGKEIVLFPDQHIPLKVMLKDWQLL